MRGMRPTTFFILGFLLWSQLVTDAFPGGSYYQDYHMGVHTPPTPPPPPISRPYLRRKYEPTPVEQPVSNYDQNENYNADPSAGSYETSQQNAYEASPAQGGYIASSYDLTNTEPQEISYGSSAPGESSSYSSDTITGSDSSYQQSYTYQPSSETTLTQPYPETTSYTAPEYNIPPVAPPYSPYKPTNPQTYEPIPPIPVYRPKKRNYHIKFYSKQKRRGSYQNQGTVYQTHYTTQDIQYGGNAQYQPETPYRKTKRPYSPPRKPQSAPKNKPHYNGSMRNPPRGKPRYSQKKHTKSQRMYEKYGMHYT